MKRIVCTLFLIGGMAATMAAQGTVSLDSCRAMALHNNKELRQAEAKIEVARHQHATAQAAYKPSIDLEASYLYNARNLSLVESDQLLPTKSFNPKTGAYDFNLVTDPQTGYPVQVNGQFVPSQVALLPKDALTYNIHHVMAGALTITQPLYMGGKIKAMNEITSRAEELARTMSQNKADDIIYDVDVAYWQVVSLVAKQKLAQSYVGLVERLDKDVKAMQQQGVATKANVLTVDVKLNEAQVDLTRVNNGVVLARMLLAQRCGLPVNTTFTLADENRDEVGMGLPVAKADMNTVLARRHDIRALELATEIYDQKARVERAAMLPSLAAMAAVYVTNPNSFNGFKNRFNGSFAVGAVLKVPIWHWGGLSNKYKAALVDAKIKRLEMEEAKEKIELQVTQANFKYQEAYKTYEMTKANLAQADENLRVAQLAFREGMSTSDEVLTAQTAWLKAHSEKIDAEIDVMMCDVYLSKVTGRMNY